MFSLKYQFPSFPTFVNDPTFVNQKMGFLGLLNTFFGSNSWFSVDRFPPLISLGFVWKSTPVAQSLRAMPKHSSPNDLCSLCMQLFKARKVAQTVFGCQTDQKLQSLFWAYFWTEFRYTQIIRGRIDDLILRASCSGPSSICVPKFCIVLWLTKVGSLTKVGNEGSMWYHIARGLPTSAAALAWSSWQYAVGGRLPSGTAWPALSPHYCCNYSFPSTLNFLHFCTLFH